jgi:very-short-patch-repair endonuclease
MTKSKAQSRLEVQAKAQLDQAGLDGYEQQYKFATGRGYRFDFAFVDAKVAVEIDGGTWTGKGHAGGKGYRHDRERDNFAQITGWVVLRYTAEMLNDNAMIAQVAAALAERRASIAWERRAVAALFELEKRKAQDEHV